MPLEPKAGRLYGNPKVHKPVRAELGILPLREIVSCSGSNVEGLGKLVDLYTRPVDEAALSYLQDTPDLLRQIQQLNEAGPQPAGTTLFSVDVLVLYPSVPTLKGAGGGTAAAAEGGAGPGPGGLAGQVHRHPA